MPIFSGLSLAIKTLCGKTPDIMLTGSNADYERYIMTKHKGIDLEAVILS